MPACEDVIRLRLLISLCEKGNMLWNAFSALPLFCKDITGVFTQDVKKENVDIITTLKWLVVEKRWSLNCNLKTSLLLVFSKTTRQEGENHSGTVKLHDCSIRVCSATQQRRERLQAVTRRRGEESRPGVTMHVTSLHFSLQTPHISIRTHTQTVTHEGSRLRLVCCWATQNHLKKPSG